MDQSKIKKVYMIGIKGVGMTMLAQYYKFQGISVSGSDIDEEFMTDEVLTNSKIKVIERFDENNIPNDVDLVVYSSAYNESNNVEVGFVLESDNFVVLTYAEALGKIFNEYYGIGVIGSHGKTTTSAWIGYILNEAGLEPNVMVGARVPQFNGSSLINKSRYLVAELDEYQNKFKFANPKIAVLNNIDYDHPDFFPTNKDYETVFINLINRLPKDGILIANYEDEVIVKIASENIAAKIISYGINREDVNYRAVNIRTAGLEQSFNVIGINSVDLGIFRIKLLGEHNILNALAVIATCVELKVDLLNIKKYLVNFSGTARRMEIMGEYNGAIIIDDYGHHPTEIKTTLKGVKKAYSRNRLICVFHPHTFTRTKALLNEFAKSFSEADEVIFLDIYGSAREEHGGINSKDILSKVEENNDRCDIEQVLKYKPTLALCEEYLRGIAGKGDVVVLMGAGDVFRIGKKLTK